jgi:hypothetical protein
MIISPLQNDWTQARADWTKANPAAVRDPSRREADANQDFRGPLWVFAFRRATG